MPTITQAELDAMLDSGEVSLMPPVEEKSVVSPTEVPKKKIFPLTPEEKDTNNNTIVQETKEKTDTYSLPSFNLPKPSYDMPEPQPLGRPLSKEENKYLLETRRDLKSIKNPEYRRKASEITRSGATIQDIDGAVAYWKSMDEYDNTKLQYENDFAKELRKEELLSKRNEYKLEQKQTRDRSKISQKIVNDYGDLGVAADHLDALVDNYDSTNVGLVDGALLGAKNLLGVGDTTKRKAHQAALAGLETSLKKAANFGANYSQYEQKLMSDMIPTDWTDEDTFKSGVYATARNIKKILQNQIESQGLAGYETGKLKNMLGKMDKVIAKTEQFDKGKTEDVEPSTVPKNLRSLKADGNESKAPAPTQKIPTALSREEKLKLLRGEL